AKRRAWGIRPAFRRVDSCAGEVEAASNYFYSTWGEADEQAPEPGKSVVILGSGPNRIGQGIEFDYCCVHAAQSFRAQGYEAVMVNCNPETVSTDYDTSDRLYFEPLDVEAVLSVCEREQPAGVVIQFGGQTPLKLARALEEAGHRIMGTPFEAIDLAEDRERFGELADSLGVRVPEWGIVEEADEAVELAERIGYPVLIRPSYVLGGRAMRVCYRAEDVRDALDRQTLGRVLVDRFLENAIEIDVDALCDGTDTYVCAVMQHVEEAGVHSGDSACVLPAPSLTLAAASEIHAVVKRLGPALGVIGLPNAGTAFLSVRDADKPACVPVAAALAGLGFRLLATGGTADTLTAAGLQVELVAKVGEENGGATILDLVRRGRCDLVINTPQGSGARTDGYVIREAALAARVPCITTISGAAAAVHAIA